MGHQLPPEDRCRLQLQLIGEEVRAIAEVPTVGNASRSVARVVPNQLAVHQAGPLRQTTRTRKHRTSIADFNEGGLGRRACSSRSCHARGRSSFFDDGKKLLPISRAKTKLEGVRIAAAPTSTSRCRAMWRRATSRRLLKTRRGNVPVDQQAAPARAARSPNRCRTVSTARSQHCPREAPGRGAQARRRRYRPAQGVGHRPAGRHQRCPTRRRRSASPVAAQALPDTKVNSGETEKVEIPGLGFVKISVLDDPNVNRRKDGTRIHADVIPVQVKLNLLGIQGTVEVLSLEVRKGACRRHADH
ncbi:MAG: hypothetical protein WKF83_03940 [Nocardioidaceae bacterium]